MGRKQQQQQQRRRLVSNNSHDRQVDNILMISIYVMAARLMHLALRGCQMTSVTTSVKVRHSWDFLNPNLL
jgi:hypothetical protein